MTQHRNPLQPVRDVKQYDPQAGGTIAARQTAGLAALTGIARAQAGQTAARRRRFISFAVIGGGVFLAGLAFQALLVRAGTGPYGSYAGQALFSIELNFLLNRSITWRDRGAPFWRSCRRFTTQRALLSIPNLLLYSAMVRLGLPWLYANVAVTAVFTVINFFFADRWSFAAAVAPAHGRHAASARGEASYRRQPVAVTPAERPGSPTKDRSERPRRGHRIADSSRIIDARGEAANRRPPGTPTGFNPADGAAYLREFTATAPAARLQSPTSRLRSSAHGEAAESPANQQRLLSVSVIVPCKDNPDTIRETVDALLSQDYPGLLEVILVGSVGDTTWRALADITDPRLQRLEQEYTPGTRDPAVKRDKGILKASGDILALADSDIVMEPGWLTAGVQLLNVQGGGVVAGGMKSIHDTFWGRFVDRNRLARKTPRLPEPYQVTAQNFGRRDRKPPITANLLFTRDVYATSPIDTSWSYGYEDYEWMWRIVQAGHPVQLTGELDGRHHHRRTFRQLAREYRRAADGCARFVKAHPTSPLARKRRWQAILLPGVAIAGAVAAEAAILSGYEIEAAAGAAAIAGAASVREFRTSRTTESLAYPLAGAALGAVFTANLTSSMLRGRTHSPADDEAPVRRTWRQRVSWPLAAILALQAALSSTLIVSNTASGDEALYLWSGRMEWAHWLHNVSLNANQLKFQDYFSGVPQLYPPIGALANAVGGLIAARTLSLCFMLIATVLLYLGAKRLFNPTAALIAATLWVSAESAMRMGAYATYDAMAISLICAATWAAIEAGHSRRHGEFVALSGVLLALGSATAYSYAIYVPAVIAVAALTWTMRLGIRQALTSAAWLAGVAILLLVFILTIFKSWHGLLFTTVARSGTLHDLGSSPSILQQAWSYGGLIMLIATAGGLIAVASARTKLQTCLCIVLIAAGFLVPAYQAFWAQTGWALDKHIAPGIWLAVMAGGAGIAMISWPRISTISRICVIAAALIFPLFSNWLTAYGVQRSWPNMTSLVTAVRPVTRSQTGMLYGADYDPSTLNYYTQPESLSRVRWVTGISLSPSISSSHLLRYYRQGLAAYSPKVVVLFFPGSLKSASLPGEVFHALQSASPQQDLANFATLNTKTPGLYDFALALEKDRDYRLVATGPYDSGFGQFGFTPNTYAIWQRVGSR